MIAPQTAWLTIVEHTAPLNKEPRPLHLALNHFLAEDVVADRDIPPANRSAMDGYAVRAEDLAQGPRSLRCIGEVAAGSPEQLFVTEGSCVRIFTGANVPPGADAVVMVEDTKTQNKDEVCFLKEVDHGKNIFRQGENAMMGDVLIRAGDRLRPGNTGICAAVGIATPMVHRLPTVAILATGEELLNIDSSVGPHQLRNSNGPTLAAALQQHGFLLVSSTTVPDNPDLIRDTMSAELRRADVLITTGGVSVGKYDFIPKVVHAAGGTVHYHGVTVKPGKPQLFATSPNRKPIFGLPGNPLSSLIGLHEFVLPALRRLAGCRPENCIPSWRLPVAEAFTSKGKRTRHVLCRLVQGDKGPVLKSVPCKGSADLVAGGLADGTAIIPVGVTRVEEGGVLEFHPWERV